MAKSDEETRKCLCKVPRIKKKLLPKAAAKAKAHYLKLLAHPTRLQILKLLSEQDLCVCVLSKTVGRSQPNVSQHLTKLRDNKIIENYGKGKLVYYRIKDEKINQLLEKIIL